MRMIFVNLPVKSVAASRAFFGALGFSFNEQFCSENTACMVIEENIFAMLLEHERFQDFINGDIAVHDVVNRHCGGRDGAARIDEFRAAFFVHGPSAVRTQDDVLPADFADLIGRGA